LVVLAAAVFFKSTTGIVQGKDHTRGTWHRGSWMVILQVLSGTVVSMGHAFDVDSSHGHKPHVVNGGPQSPSCDTSTQCLAQPANKPKKDSMIKDYAIP
jgi:hypothetical protein